MRSNYVRKWLLAVGLLVVSGSMKAYVYSGSCGSSANYSLDTETGLLSITGSGSMYNYSTSDNYNTSPYTYGSTAPWSGSRNQHILSINIGEGITSIGDAAFRGCNALITVELPSTLTYIGDYAFSRCTGVTTLNIPDGVTYIGAFAFFESSFKSITIGSGITQLYNSTFAGCRKLTSLVIPEGVTNMERNVFCACEELVSISLPEGLTNISETSFQFCRKLAEINIPSTVTTIDKSAFDDCRILSSLIIPANVINIGEYAFSNCSNLTTVLIRGAETIGNSAFSNCRQMETIELPENLKSIGTYAFSHCESLSSIYIPSSVTSIGANAFDYCTNLSSVTIWRATPPTLGSQTGTNNKFYGVTLHVANGRKSSYSSATNWSNITNIVEVLRPGDVFTSALSSYLSMTFKVTSNTTCQVGNGSNPCISTDYNYDVSIPSEVKGFLVTSISDKAFFTCSNMPSISIPLSVTAIGEQTFWGCSSLMNIRLLESTTPPIVTSNTFSYYNNVSVHVPAGSKDNYEKVNYWKDFILVEAGRVERSLTDGEEYVQSANIFANTITYSRTYKNTNWQAWYVPFEVELTSDLLSRFSFAKYAGTYVDENSDPSFFITIARLKAGDKLKANTPYFVQAKTASNTAQVISVANTTLKPAQETGFDMYSAEQKVSIRGVYSAKTATAGDCDWYAYGGGSYFKATAGAVLNPYRVYLTITERDDNPYGTSEAPNEIKVKLLGDDGATIIEEVQGTEEVQDAQIYDLSGRRIMKDKLDKGIYIINGKKVLVR